MTTPGNASNFLDLDALQALAFSSYLGNLNNQAPAPQARSSSLRTSHIPADVQPRPVRALDQSNLMSQLMNRRRSDFSTGSAGVGGSFQQMMPPPNKLPTATIPTLTKPSSSSLSSRKKLAQQKRFLVFVRILLKSLDHDVVLKQQVKLILAECTRRNRMGDPKYCPLQVAVERNVRALVGDARWIQAQQNLNIKLSQSKQRLIQV